MDIVFDRGTLTCSSISGLPVEQRGQFTWDPRVALYRAPASAYASLRNHAGNHLHLETAYFPPPRVVPAPELRPYQAAALEAWQTSGRRGVVVLPTGAGKTRLALAAIATCECPTLVLTPTRILLAQWLALARELWGEDCGVLGDGEIDARPITIATFESAYRHMHALGNRFELVVVDEAHHFGGGERSEMLAMCVAPARLGLTATPPRSGEPVTRLERSIGPIIFEVRPQTLVGTYLAEHVYEKLHIALNTEERATYDRCMSAFRRAQRELLVQRPAATFADLCRLLSATQAGRQALSGFREARRLASFTQGKARVLASLLAAYRDRRTIIFTAENEAAYAIASEHLVAPLTADIKRTERESLLAAFHAGEVRALVSARVLNEGFDVPLAEVGIIVGAALGEREHAQRVGRLLRAAPGKQARIYELVSAGTYEVDRSRKRSHR